MTNVLKIRNNKETYVYRCDLSGDKKVLLTQFRQVAEELAARRRKEREGEHERRKSLWVGGGGDVCLHIPVLRVLLINRNRTDSADPLHLTWALLRRNG